MDKYETATERSACKRKATGATGGGTAIKDAVIDPGVALVAPHLIVEIENVIDSDSCPLEQSLPVETNVIESPTSVEVNSNVKNFQEVSLISIMSPVEKSQNDETSDSSSEIKKITQDVITIQSSSSAAILPSLQLPPNKISCRDTSRTRSTLSAVSTKKGSNIRMKREKQLIVLDKLLYEQRIACEKENTRKLKAEADLAELELQIRKRKAEEDLEQF